MFRLTDDQKDKIKDMARAGKSLSAIGKETGNAHGTIVRVLKEANLYKAQKSAGTMASRKGGLPLSTDNVFLRLADAEERLVATKKQIATLEKSRDSIEREIEMLLEERGLMLRPNPPRK